MKDLEAYKASLIKEINSNKEMLIEMGFDWPSEDLNYNNNLGEIEEFYAEIMGYAAVHNFIAENYPHTPGR